MVIEYIGEVIRTELSECREKQYEAKVNISLLLYSLRCLRGLFVIRIEASTCSDWTMIG